MSKRPAKTEEEINAIVDFVKGHETQKVTVDSKEILPLLNSQDQTVDRVTKLLAKPLKDEGIGIRKHGEKLVFTMTTSVVSTPEHSSSSVEVVQDEADKVLQDPSAFKTKLTHKFKLPRGYSDIKNAVQAGSLPLLVGPPGCGKSILLEEVYCDLNIPFSRMSLGGYVDPLDILGGTQLVDGENGVITRFVPGILTEAVEFGKGVIFDEFDTMSPLTNSIFQRITETDGQLVLRTEKGSRVFKKHPLYRIAYTANTDGHGDASGMFAGAQVQNSALLDRINVRFYLDYNPIVECAILRDDYGLPEGVINALFGKDGKDKDSIVNTIRRKCSDTSGGWRTHLTMRMLIDFAKHFVLFNGSRDTFSFGWHKAFYHCILLKFPVEYRNPVCDIVRNVCGPGFEPTNVEADIKKMAEEMKKKNFFPTGKTWRPSHLA